MPEKIGFVGLGIMGQRMALNLLKADFSLTVWNRTAGKMDPLVQAGAFPADSASEVAEKSDICVACVGDTADVETVILGEKGIAEGAGPGSLVIDCSTISPVSTKIIAEKLAKKDIAMLDAPVSGGSSGAENATLSIMVGGLEKDVERGRPVLEAMGKTITHVGGNGVGQTVKLINQILVAGNLLAMSEALLFAQAGGVDLKKVLPAVQAGTAGSWMLSNRGPKIIERDWNPGFTIDLQQKDVRLALDAANDLGVPLPGTGLISQLYRGLQAQGRGSQGNHALIKALENLCGVIVGS